MASGRHEGPKKARRAAAAPAPKESLSARAERIADRAAPHGTPDDDPRRLLHELDVHRIELELQNEELRAVRLDLEIGLARYSQLFRLAPIGYAILEPDGTILEINAAGARLFGPQPGGLLKTRLALFVPHSHRASLSDFLLRVQARGAEEPTACELPLELLDDRRHVLLTGVALRADAPSVLVALEDVTARRRAEAELRAAHEELETRVAQRTSALAHATDRLRAELQLRNDLRRRLARAQEDERGRMARDLHDSVGQRLAALGLAVKAIGAEAASSPRLRRHLDELEQLVNAAAREVRDVAVRLRPTALDDLGLRPALEQLVGEWSARAPASIDLHVIEERLPYEVETVLYRVVQEALTNVAKHAAAKTVSVAVTRYDGLAIAMVEDDGVGFDLDAAPAGRLGLVGMRERVTLALGDLVIESSKGSGTTVIARVPLVAPHEALSGTDLPGSSR